MNKQMCILLVKSHSIMKQYAYKNAILYRLSIKFNKVDTISGVIGSERKYLK